jgi:hypothetical protein
VTILTGKEKQIIYDMIDNIQAALEMSKEIGIRLGIEGESKFEMLCRDSISKGYKVINGNADRE